MLKEWTLIVSQKRDKKCQIYKDSPEKTLQ